MPYSIFCSVTEFLRGDKTQVVYRFSEKGYLRVLDPEGKQASQILWEYCPLWGDIWAVPTSGLRLRPAKIDSLKDRWLSTLKPEKPEPLS